MQKESALEAQRVSTARGPSGLRRLSLAMLATGKLAEDFKGIGGGEGGKRPGHVLAAFKGAAPFLGFCPRIIHAIDWLFGFTQPQDWAEGSRPIVWPSAALQREALGLGVTQVKALNRQLVELGLVTMKDSPNGKRYGRRDRQGRLIEAYGFDLSPLYARMAEFSAIAAQGRELRERMRLLRRRATIASNGLLQILETAAEHGLFDASWHKLEGEGRALARSLKGVERVEEMEFGVACLERRQLEARERLENQLAEARRARAGDVDSDPKGPEYRPHIYNYKSPLNPEQDTVMASEGSRAGVAGAGIQEPAPTLRKEQDERKAEPRERTDCGTLMRITPGELAQLAPRLRSYLATSSPAWPEIVEAADWLRHDLQVSKPLWGDACLAMGREQAAIALAIVSAKPESHFTASPASYFHGMVKRAQAGQLNLARTIWGLRENSGRRTGASGRQDRARGEFFNS